MLHNRVGIFKLLEGANYIKEIESAVISSDDFRIENRDSEIEQMLLALEGSPYPHLALIGAQGTGKSLTLDYILSLLTGKTLLPEEHAHSAKVRKIKERISQFQKRDHLFLPNFQDHFSIEPIDYKKNCEDALINAQKFSNDVLEYFNNLPLEENLYHQLSADEYMVYVETAIKSMANDAHKVIDEMLIQADAYVKFNIPDDLREMNVEFSPLTDISVQTLYEFAKNKFGFGHDAKTENIISAIAQYLAKTLSSYLYGLQRDIEHLIVDGVDADAKRRIVIGSINKYNAEVEQLKDDYFNKSPYFFLNWRRHLASVSCNIEKRVSSETLEMIINSLNVILQRHIPEDDLRLRKWMEETISYLTGNASLEKNVRKYLRSVESYAESKIATLLYGKKTTCSNPSFTITYAGREMALSNVLSASVYFQSGGDNAISIKYVSRIDDEVFFGKFNDSSDAQKEPPHKRFRPGYLVDAGVIVLSDDMQGFFRALLKDECRRKTFLNLCEKGEFVYEQGGITVRMNSPTLIFGCDNDFPFVKKGFIESLLERDEAMASRFNIISWKDYTHNTEEVRQGTIRFIKREIMEFQNARGVRLNVDSSVINWLLGSNSTATSHSLVYRDIRKEVHNILEFCSSINCSEVTLEQIIKWEKEKECERRFTLVDRQFHSTFIKEDGEVKVGYASGIGLYEGDIPHVMVGRIHPLTTKILLDRAENSQQNFILSDQQSRLSASDLVKGYFETIDYIKKLIEHPINFVVSISFEGNYAYIAGPSASLPLALSIFSALTKTPLSPYCASTGRINSYNGHIGNIAGVYDKAANAWRWFSHHEILGKRKPLLMFPPDNFEEIRHRLRTSPYPIAEELEIIPVPTFEYAWYLATHDDTLTALGELECKACKYFQHSIKKARRFVRKYNKRVDNH